MMPNSPSMSGEDSRIDFSKISTSIPIPNLIDVQKRSYDKFLQLNLLTSEREDFGLKAVFNSVFPITNFKGTCSLEFVDYSIGTWQCRCGKLDGLENLRSTCAGCGARIIHDDPLDDAVICQECGALNKSQVQLCDNCGDPVSLQLKYDVQECQERGMTYSVHLKVRVRLVVWDRDPETNVRSIRDIKEQEVYFGDIPLMTDSGTFIINGTERVIVSQLHRSPGVFFHADPRKSTFSAQIIPYRGSWVEFEFDAKNLLYVRIDRKRKFLATVFLKALGLRNNEDIIRSFFPVQQVDVGEDGAMSLVLNEGLVGRRFGSDIKIPGSRKSEPLVAAGKRFSNAAWSQLKKTGKEARIPVTLEDLGGGCLVRDVINLETGEVDAEPNVALDEGMLEKVLASGMKEFDLYFPESSDLGETLTTTMLKDTVAGTEDALLEIYRRLRPGDPPTVDSSKALFEGMFFNAQRYDFSRVGRLKFNTKLGKPAESDLERRVLSPEDVYDVVRYLLKLKKNIGYADDIDHLGNRRVRSVGELLENQFRIGLVRMERAIKEKMSVFQEMTSAMPFDLINAKPVIAAIREFFGSSQLSQFMDQTNPLSEITHKRRLSALGPGGLSRERAGFEVRDVHTTHYGRICPIETPEGPNIGLISSLSTFARINEYGFIESPYSKVENGRVVDYVKVYNPGDTKYKLGDQVTVEAFTRANNDMRKKKMKQAQAHPFPFYLSAWEEDRYTIAQANAPLDSRGRFINDRVNARRRGDSRLVPKEEIDFIDVSPKQLVSVAAALIPFLEHDDANRALMGSNMQRQAVPLLKAEAPVVGTGMEGRAARDSGAVVISRRGGVVDRVDASRIIIKVERKLPNGEKEYTAEVYDLTKFHRSNQNTCINQKPIVEKGQKVEQGQIIADGPCTDNGELALGRNVLVAFMPWRGYNFEDAMLVSERLVRDDYYTSIHIEEFEVESRDTKMGPEEITRDIPNVSEDAMRELDDSGIIRIGAYVKPGDILVGKVTPKGETQLTPEEKLLRAIFGEKAGDVRDASLATPPGIEGIVVDVKVFARKGADKDTRTVEIEFQETEKMERNLNDRIRIIREEWKNRAINLLRGKTLSQKIVDAETDEVLIAAGAKLQEKNLKKISFSMFQEIRLKGRSDKIEAELAEMEASSQRQVDILKKLYTEKVERMKKGDELPPGVIKMVKVYVAMKRKLSVGDKMAGRHGNKGVISRVVPEEDMPYLPDGTPVDLVLNPLGVPSRMNVGQILETHLGWAARALGITVATPVFDGAKEVEIKELLTKAGLPTNGKSEVFDGMSGEAFEQQVTVGYIYIMKLSHLVDDKIHARSIGPYSLITQQPLGGKAQFGGQRFGEMEVWALEAYGAANILQELLTSKSDDVYGRTKIYEALVKGEVPADPGLPESFNVLIRELQSLCLDVELKKRGDRKVQI
jgi:DNA-directed RNA polymerase subunit beta